MLLPSVRVAITAVGVVSPLGVGLSETLEALRSSRDCVGPVRLFDASLCHSKSAGQVDDSRLVRPNASRLHRASLMLIAATAQALEADPGFKPEQMVIGTTSGGMSFGEAFYRSLMSIHDATPLARRIAERRNWPGWVANYLPQKPVLDVLDALGFCVPCQIIANACASGANAIGHAFGLIRNGVRTRVIAGGYDAISELVFVGFDSLQASTPEKCRPFDKGRSGLVMGEGAAVLAMEAMDSALGRGAPVLGEVTGYGISTDNYHLTQPHPSGCGPLLAMRRALDSAELAPAEIDYINAHGTATTFNDATEGAAIAQLFGSRRPPVSSTKALMGHSLGAAGAIEAVISLLALLHDFLPPNAHYREADPQWDLDIVANEPRFIPVRRVLSNSFGFGGANASLILEKAKI
jgi:3-oxoacyl-[acyl-carrier-protein] synthase II